MNKNKYIVFAGMGFELIGIIIATLILGQWLDEKFNLKGLSMIGFSMAGLSGWIYHIILLAKKMEEKTKE
jgi:F0F1-type ATP synthase assembly protein I